MSNYFNNFEEEIIRKNKSIDFLWGTPENDILKSIENNLFKSWN